MWCWPALHFRISVVKYYCARLSAKRYREPQSSHIHTVEWSYSVGVSPFVWQITFLCKIRNSQNMFSFCSKTQNNNLRIFITQHLLQQARLLLRYKCTIYVNQCRWWVCINWLRIWRAAIYPILVCSHSNNIVISGHVVRPCNWVKDFRATFVLSHTGTLWL
jgi:hypothetical protein